MGYERYPRDTNPQGDYYDRSDTQDYGHDYASGRSFSYSSARDYEAMGEIGNDQRRGYGNRDDGNRRYGQRDARYQGRGGYQGGGYQGGRGQGDRSYGERDREPVPYRGSYASDGHRFEDVGRFRNADNDYYNDPDARTGSYGRPPQGYNQQDRGFFQRAGDEVRSWFGDDDAERRREQDARYDGRAGERNDAHRDSDYHSWRSGQIAALDRDYDEYRQENRTKFHNEFGAWRSNRQGQRDLLGKVDEHMDVVGSDGEHVGTVDKVRGDRILLTKNDRDAGGQHHSIPSSWLQGVDGKVTLAKTAAEAKQQWREEDRDQAMFQYGDRTGQGRDQGRDEATSTRLRQDDAAKGPSRSTAKTY